MYKISSRNNIFLEKMPVEEKWEGSQGGWEGHLTGRQIWPCKERGKEERREGSEEGRSMGFGCPSLSHSRALNLCVIVACHWPQGQGQWLASLGMTPLCSLSGSPGGSSWLDPCPPEWNLHPMGKSERRRLLFLACYFWNRVRPLNRCWWKEGAQTSGLDCQEQSLCTAGLEGRSTAGSWPLPRRISGTPVLWTTAPWAGASITEQQGKSHGSVPPTHMASPKI